MNDLGTKLVFYGISDKGMQRENNEDHFIVADLSRKVVGVYDNRVTPDLICHEVGTNGTLIAVADGLGGHEKGEVASHIAVEATVESLFQMSSNCLFSSDWLAMAVKQAHETIQNNHADGEYGRGMGSTLTAVHIGTEGLTVAQVGDSRAYMFRDGKLSLLTEDQTLVGLLQKRGMLTREQAEVHPSKHVILQALGQEKDVVPELRSCSVKDGDYLLLCTDGLTSYVDEAVIEAILSAEADECTHCQWLVDAANGAGGADNVTVLLVRLKMPYGHELDTQEVTF